MEQYGFKYSELRNATVPQLLKMAHICCMWDEVIDACKQQEAKRDTKSSGKKRQVLASIPQSFIFLSSSSSERLSLFLDPPQEEDKNRDETKTEANIQAFVKQHRIASY